MHPRAHRFLPVLSLTLAACGQVTADRVVDIEWAERQSVYRLNTAQSRIDVFALRGGIAPLGTIRLRPGLCPTSLALDKEHNRLLLWGKQGGVAFDARSLRPVHQWEAGAYTPDTPLPNAPAAALYRAVADTSGGCETRARMLQAMTEQIPKN